ncbi:HNH endonuclease [Halobacteriovorax sp. HFRX-2_2]|uniref:HNH endonuclease n=1 Tax=unclassified Halobacteriovorax TaxID=2639665 RepID=UPI003717DE6D
MEQVFKIVNNNELGLDSQGRSTRGTALLVPKSFWCDLLEFDETESNPVVETTILVNNSVFIPISFRLYNSFTNKPNKRECRIYLNDFLKSQIEKDDIIAFSYEDSPFVIKLDYYKKGTDEYLSVKSKLGSSKGKKIKGHTNSQQISHSNTENDVGKIKSPFIGVKSKKSKITQTETRDNSLQTTFRSQALFHYKHQCAIKKTSITHENKYCLDAAHIVPWSKGGTFHVANSLLLSKDLHWAFDLGLFSISDEYKVVLSSKVDQDSPLAKYNKVSISVPSNANAQPLKEALKWHRENILL